MGMRVAYLLLSGRSLRSATATLQRPSWLN